MKKLFAAIAAALMLISVFPVQTSMPDYLPAVQTKEVLFTPAAVPTEPAPEKSEEIIVYRTRTGKRYHIDGCRSLYQSKIEITLEQAIEMGLTPCLVCSPDRLRDYTQNIK